MNRNDIIRMAREAWGLHCIPDTDVLKLERFAALAAAAAKEEEREACANLIQDLCDRRVPASEYADAICARSWK